ncbi:hypothetical protein FKM82_001465 [Ascaphus truei]
MIPTRGKDSPARAVRLPAMRPLRLLALCLLLLPGLGRATQEDDGTHRNREPPLPQRPDAAGGRAEKMLTPPSAVRIGSEESLSATNMGFIHAFVAAISVIIVSELGDKTFFIAAIMAMRYNRLTVLAGAMLALGLMTCLSAFTLTFLAEWGDRSQLTTIVLAAREDPFGVAIGGTIGHSLCTGLAVIGGRMIAQKISVRTVTIIGGIVFLAFAFSALFISPDAGF